MLKSYRKVWSRRVSSHVESGTNALISLVGQITGAGQANANSAFHFLLQPPFRESLNLSRPRRGNLKIKPLYLMLHPHRTLGGNWRQLGFGYLASSPFVQCCWPARMQIGRRGEAQYAAPPAPPLLSSSSASRAKPDSAQPLLLVNKDAAERAHRQWRWCVPPIGANQASLPAPASEPPNHGDQIQIRDRTDSQTPMII